VGVGSGAALGVATPPAMIGGVVAGIVVGGIVVVSVRIGPSSGAEVTAGASVASVASVAEVAEAVALAFGVPHYWPCQSSS
jgi:hypothetical protein